MTEAVPNGAGEESQDAILDELLEADERGEIPDLEHLRARPGIEPGNEQVVEELWRNLQVYRRLRSELRAAPTSGLLVPGERLGDFEIESILAQGGMGVVYRARQLSLDGRPVALKVLPAELRSEHNRRRFRQEARLLAELHHAHLAEVFGFGEDETHVYYAMRLVEGCTLWDLMAEVADGRRSPVPLRRAVEWIAEVAAALAVVHAAGLVHRDIKPANIMLEGGDDRIEDAHAVLVDFGLVRAVAEERNGATLHGSLTPAYAAPEQLLGRPLDARADVFSLGVTLHDLLARREPHMRSRASAGLEPLTLLVPDVDEDLAAVVSKAVDPDAGWRYGQAGALHADLAAWLEGRHVSARRPGPWERARRWVQLHPVRFVRRVLGSLVAAVVLSLLVVLGVGYVETAGEARRAFDEHRIEQLATLSGQLPALIRPWLLREPTLELTVKRLADPAWDAEARRLQRIVTRLQDNETLAAYVEAFASLRVAGLAADPFITGYALSRLDGDATAAGKAFADLRSAALGLNARLFYERPDGSPEEHALSAGFRARLFDLVDNADVEPAHDVLHALTGLSGCGAAEDVMRLVDFALRHELGTEQRRLGLFAAERIVRRLHRWGTLDALPSALLLGRLEAPLRQALSAPRAVENFRHAVVDLVVALALVERGRGVRNSVDAFLPPIWLASLRAGRPLEGFPQRLRFDQALLLAAFADARMTGWWRATASLNRNPGEWVARYARLGALAEDPAFVEELRETVDSWSPEAQRDEWRSHLAEKLVVGSEELHGQRDGFALDADTLLGVEMPHDATRLLSKRDDEIPDTWFDFRSKPATLSGGALSLELIATTHYEESPSDRYLRLGAAGTSTVRLEFDLPASEEAWVLNLTHVAASRRYYPHHGEVRLTIRLDGEVLRRDDLVSRVNTLLTPIPLPRDRATAGRHELSIELEAVSTTTYRLIDAWIVPRRL